MSLSLRCLILGYYLPCVKNTSECEHCVEELTQVIGDIINDPSELFERVSEDPNHFKQVSQTNYVLSHETTKSLLTPEQEPIMGELTREFVGHQIDTFFAPEVMPSNFHLRSLKNICSILRYPRDHWEGRKELL